MYHASDSPLVDGQASNQALGQQHETDSDEKSTKPIQQSTRDLENRMEPTDANMTLSELVKQRTLSAEVAKQDATLSQDPASVTQAKKKQFLCDTVTKKESRHKVKFDQG